MVGGSLRWMRLRWGVGKENVFVFLGMQLFIILNSSKWTSQSKVIS